VRIIEIPYSPVNLFLFYGKDDKVRFDKKVRHQYQEWESSEDTDGMHFQNHVYVEDKKDKEVLLHEIFHFTEWLFSYMEIENEPEFKACLQTHIIMEVLKCKTFI
jgi:hypothetical protein